MKFIIEKRNLKFVVLLRQLETDSCTLCLENIELNTNLLTVEEKLEYLTPYFYSIISRIFLWYV